MADQVEQLYNMIKEMGENANKAREQGGIMGNMMKNMVPEFPTLPEFNPGG